VERLFNGAGKRERQNPGDLEQDYHQDSRPGTAKQVYSVHYYRLVHRESEGKATGEEHANESGDRLVSVSSTVQNSTMLNTVSWSPA
jgi:hypothetical protein